MHVIVWTYVVAPGHEVAFRAAYARDGDWALLFARGGGFLGTSLFEDAVSPGVFLTLDRWRSASDFEAFKSQHAEAYAALDARCAALTAAETRLGAFDTADV